MTKSLEKAMSAAERLPARLQNQVADFLMEEVSRAELLAKIKRAEREIRTGRVVTHQEAKQRMRRWLK